ncbi:MAG: response regulator [Anaerolineales bacterium]|nr:response regulator [Anaerolineales bacterium]
MPERHILLIESDAAAAAYLANLLRQAGYAVSTAPGGKEGLIEAWRGRPDMMIVTAELPDLGGLEVVRKLRGDARTNKAKVIILSTRSYPQDILAGVQAGADEYIVKRPGADGELLERVRALLPRGVVEPAAAPEPARPLARLVSFLSAKGGTGTSSLCVNVAQVVAQQAPAKRLAVVDLVLPVGSLHYIVGVDTPDRHIVAATRLEPRHLTPERLQPLLTRREEWGFDLLPGAPDPEVAQELRVERLEAVFAALRQMYDLVFVDFGRALSRVSLPFIRQSAKVFVITSPDAATVALTKAVLNYLDLQDVRRHRLQLVLNRAVGLEGLSRPEMERELGFAISALIPHMGSHFSLANNQHQPVSRKFASETVPFTLQNVALTLLEQLNQQADDAAPVSA